MVQATTLDIEEMLAGCEATIYEEIISEKVRNLQQIFLENGSELTKNRLRT